MGWFDTGYLEHFNQIIILTVNITNNYKYKNKRLKNVSLMLLVAGVSSSRRFGSALSSFVPARTILSTWDSVNRPSSKKCDLMYSASGLSFFGLGKMTQSSGISCLGGVDATNPVRFRQ